jgi:hypothetical protein
MMPNNKSSNLKVTSLAAVCPTMSSGEKSIEKMRM